MKHWAAIFVVMVVLTACDNMRHARALADAEIKATELAKQFAHQLSNPSPAGFIKIASKELLKDDKNAGIEYEKFLAMTEKLAEATSIAVVSVDDCTLESTVTGKHFMCTRLVLLKHDDGQSADVIMLVASEHDGVWSVFRYDDPRIYKDGVLTPSLIPDRD